MISRRATFLFALLAGCTADVDYAGTDFLCAEEEVCPPGFVCVDGRCREQDGASPEDGGVAGPMVTIPAGAFLLGCDPAEFPDCPEDAQPKHAVELSEFEIDRTEVTRAAYQECVEAGACTDLGYDTSALPATDLLWYQARTFCEWAGKRLPTEAEWERAARGTDERAYPWGEAAPDCTRANFVECGLDLEAAGARASGASPDGVLDMAGNAAEWVADVYDPTYYQRSPARDPQGPGSGEDRVQRGGSFGDTGAEIRTFVRDFDDPSDDRDEVGFRCAR